MTFNAEGELVEGTFSEQACTAAADLADTRVEGLLLAKTGITPNIASAFGRIVGIKGKTITELGWDIRKALGLASPNGSHCGAGAPRWNVVIDGVLYFVGCNSGLAQVDGQAWIRQRWVHPIYRPGFLRRGHPRQHHHQRCDGWQGCGAGQIGQEPFISAFGSAAFAWLFKV